MWALLRNGNIIDPSQGIETTGDVLIENGRIFRVGGIIHPPISAQASRGEVADSPPFSGEGLGERCQVYDCAGLTITPGLIDMHVHLREPGYEHKETIRTAAEAAAAGGFTTIVGMPNTHPAVDTRAVVEYVINRGKQAAVTVLTSGAATKANAGEEMAEIGDMKHAGAVAISDDAFPIQSADLMRRVLEYSRMFDLPVLVHCEDKSLTAGGVMNEGITATMLGLRPWPRQAEETMIWRNILLAELAKCRLHIQHVTTAGGVEAVRWAKARGINVTAETCPQYFSLTDEALNTYDTNAKINPPLRTPEDVEAIKAGLADGAIEVIATDHAPHAQEDKEVELQDALFGMVGLETAVALVITNLVKPGVLTMAQAIEKMTVAPAGILGIPAGALSEGAQADITIIDPNAQVTVRATDFKSMGRNTPFDGAELTGKVVATIARGAIVHGADALKIAESLKV